MASDNHLDMLFAVLVSSGFMDELMSKSRGLFGDAEPEYAPGVSVNKRTRPLSKTKAITWEQLLLTAGYKFVISMG